MEYTKSQIWKITEEQKTIIFNALETIDCYVGYISTEKGYNFKCKMYVDSALEKLSKALDIISDIILNTENCKLGVEILDMIKPKWGKYCSYANRGDFEYHEEAPKIQNIINCLQKWIDEQNTRSSMDNFFTAFESLAHDCIVSIGFKYRTRTEKPKKPTDIVGQMEAYKKTVVISELMKEIQNRIENCKTPSEMELYIISLLLPFREFCEVLRPPTPTNESRVFIKLLCTGIINQEKLNPGTIENCLRLMLNDMNDYALGLYNVLFQNSIDLNEYQQKTGVYFRKEWNPANGMFFNLGDWDLIENLPLVETDEQQASDISVETAGATKTTIEKNDDIKKELGITEKLQSIFYNNEAILQKFLQRTKGKKGARIVDDVWVLIQMGKIDNEEAGEDLRQELLSLGYDTTTKQNWSDQLGKRRHDVVFEKIKKEYQSEGNSTKE